MERESESWQTGAAQQVREPLPDAAAGGELLDRLGIIESQPLDQRARGFEQLHDELMQELQRSDNEVA